MIKYKKVSKESLHKLAGQRNIPNSIQIRERFSQSCNNSWATKTQTKPNKIRTH